MIKQFCRSFVKLFNKNCRGTFYTMFLASKLLVSRLLVKFCGECLIIKVLYHKNDFQLVLFPSTSRKIANQALIDQNLVEYFEVQD